MASDSNPKSPDQIAGEIERLAQPSPEAVAAFKELQKDAPPGEGPIVRSAKAFYEPREAQASDRQVHVENARLHTNPVGQEAIAARVAVVPRVNNREHITVPGLKKVEQLGIEAAPVAIGRNLGGSTQILAKNAAQAAIAEKASSDLVEDPSETLDQVTVVPRKRIWPWAVLVFALFGALGGGLIWYTQAVRVDEREFLERAKGVATATARAAQAVSLPSVVTAPSATVETPAAVSTEAAIESAPTLRPSSVHTPDERPTALKPSASTTPPSTATSPSTSPSTKASSARPTATDPLPYFERPPKK